MMNSDLVKPDKYGNLHLVYHFTVPLMIYVSSLTHTQIYSTGTNKVSNFYEP